MNVHHVELFYYVARFGGITRAARSMPYGIQQPAISGQLRRFEKELGVTLFQREPFQLTERGEELYEFARPFFDGVDTVEAHLRTQSSPRLRIAASELVLQHYLPSAIGKFRRRHPDVRFVLQAGGESATERALRDGQLDLAIALRDGPPPAALKCARIVELSLALLVPARSALRSAGELWACRSD
jgi:DNA-binding transcriptional LysR family regulator